MFHKQSDKVKKYFYYKHFFILPFHLIAHELNRMKHPLLEKASEMPKGWNEIRHNSFVEKSLKL